MQTTNVIWTEQEASAWLRTYPWACFVAQLEVDPRPAPADLRPAPAARWLRTVTRMAAAMDDRTQGERDEAALDIAGWPALIAGLID